MTQAAMAELNQTTPKNTTTHLRSIYRQENLTRRQLVRITYKFIRKAREGSPALEILQSASNQI